MATIKTLVVKLVGDVDGFQQQMLSGTQAVQQAGQNMQQAGGSLTRNVTLPLAGAGVAAFKMSTDFNEGMANVASLSQDAAASVGEWKPQMQELAIEVGKSTDDMAGGMYNVVSAFGAGDESLLSLEINARAASAGLATTTDSINLTSAVTKGYGDTSAAAQQRVADMALQTVALGQTTFPELAASIGRVTPITAELGVQQEELFGTMATLTGVTGGAAEVSTQLRSVLQSMMSPTGDMTTLMGDLGFESGKAMLDQLGLHGSIVAITEASGETGIPLAKYIGSIEGQTAALALAGPQSDVYLEKLAAMRDASGAVDTAFAAQTEGVNASGFAMAQAGVQLTTYAQKLGDSLGPAALAALAAGAPLLDWLGEMIDRFAALDPETQTIILGVLALAAAAGPLLIVLGSVVSSIGMVAGWLAFLASPIGLVVALVAGLALAWATNFGGMRDRVERFMVPVRGVVELVADYLQPTFERAREALARARGGVSDISEAFGGMLAAAGRLWEALQPIVTIVGTVLVVVFSYLLNVAIGVFGRIGPIVAAAVGIVTAYLDSMAGMIEGAIDFVVAVFNGDWDGAWDAAGRIVSSWWDGVTGILGGIYEFFKQIFLGAIEGVIGWMEDLVGPIETTPEQIFAIFELFNWGSIGSFIMTGIANGVTNAVSVAKNALVGAGEAMFQGVKDFFGIESPSRLMGDEVGAMLPPGIPLGAEKTAPAAAAQLRDVLGSMTDGVELALPAFDVPPLLFEAAGLDGVDAGLDRFADRSVVVSGDFELDGLDRASAALPVRTLEPGVQRLELGLDLRDETSDLKKRILKAVQPVVEDEFKKRGRRAQVLSRLK